MSTSNIQALLDKASTDTALQQKLEALKDTPLDDLLHLASDEGFPFSAEDWQAYLEKSGALSDADLSSVSGGNAWGDAITWYQRNQIKKRDRAILNLGPEQE